MATWEEALSRLVDAVDVGNYEDEINTLRESLSGMSDMENIRSELDSVKQTLAERETAYSDLEEKYRTRFKELLNANSASNTGIDETIVSEEEPGKPITFADLSLDAETE